MNNILIINLVRVCETTHSAHDAEDVVVRSVDANLSGLDTSDGVVGKDKLEGCVINSGEVTAATRLVLFGAKGEGVNVNTSVGGTSVMLVWLHKVEVSAFALREAVLAVKLELGGYNGVLTPAVHLEGGLVEDECTSVGDGRPLRVAGASKSL